MARTTFNVENDFRTAVAIGALEGIEGGSWFCKGVSLAADTTVIIGRANNNLVLPPDTGQAIEINNTDALNAGAIIDLEVLDQNFNRVFSRVIITGVGNFTVNDPVSGLPVLVSRVNSAVNRGLRGTGEVVTAMNIRSVATPANIFGVIGLAQEMQQGIRTVPAGYSMIVYAVSGVLLKSSGTEVAVDFSLEGGVAGNVLRQFFSFGAQRSGTSSNNYVNYDNSRIPEKVDLVLRATPGAASADVAARMAFILVKN